MNILNIQKEYEWVLEVLESCLNQEQIKTTEKLFKNFIYKWIDDLSEERLERFNWNFQKYMSQKKLRLKRMESI